MGDRLGTPGVVLIFFVFFKSKIKKQSRIELVTPRVNLFDAEFLADPENIYFEA